METKEIESNLIDAVSVSEIEARGMAEILLALRESSSEPRDSLDLLYADAMRIAERLSAAIDAYTDETR